MPTVDVSITWAPNRKATLAKWIDDGKSIQPQDARAFVGVGEISFSYPSSDTDGFHEFKWALVFTGRTLHDIVVRASWDGGSTWHTVGSRKNDKGDRWTSFGTAP